MSREIFLTLALFRNFEYLASGSFEYQRLTFATIKKLFFTPPCIVNLTKCIFLLAARCDFEKVSYSSIFVFRTSHYLRKWIYNSSFQVIDFPQISFVSKSNTRAANVSLSIVNRSSIETPLKFLWSSFEVPMERQWSCTHPLFVFLTKKISAPAMKSN